MIVVGRKLAEAHGALQDLGKRFLPTLDADLKIGALLERVTDTINPLVRNKNRIATRVVEEFGGPQAVDKLSNLAKQMVLAKVQEEQDKLDDEEIEIVVPEKWLVTQADLPKERSGDEGWKNATGRGWVVAALGPFFVHPKE